MAADSYLQLFLNSLDIFYADNQCTVFPFWFSPGLTADRSYFFIGKIVEPSICEQLRALFIFGMRGVHTNQGVIIS